MVNYMILQDYLNFNWTDFFFGNCLASCDLQN